MHHVARRLIAALGLFWLVVSITFVLVHLAPGDPSLLLVPTDASAADAARMRHELGLDAPLPVQYGRWMGQVVTGNLGESIALHRPVRAVLADAMPLSLALGAVSLIVTFVAGVAIGLLQALRRGRASDTLLTVATTAGYAAPSFWLSLALVAVFTSGAARWGWPAMMRLPAFGVRDPGGELTGFAAMSDIARHAILPVLVLSIVGAAGIARYARTSFLDVLGLDFVRTSRAKGLPPRGVYGRHVLRVAMPPLVVLLALSLPGVVAGQVFVENVFAWPGMGRTMVSAVGARDYPVVLGATMAYAALVIIANLVADAVLPLLDPRRA